LIAFLIDTRYFTMWQFLCYYSGCFCFIYRRQYMAIIVMVFRRIRFISRKYIVILYRMFTRLLSEWWSMLSWWNTTEWDSTMCMYKTLLWYSMCTKYVE